MFGPPFFVYGRSSRRFGEGGHEEGRVPQPAGGFIKIDPLIQLVDRCLSRLVVLWCEQLPVIKPSLDSQVVQTML